MFDAKVVEAFSNHAMIDYPYEACGVVVDGAYHPVLNIHSHPKEAFRVNVREMFTHFGKMPDAVIHSHPDGPNYPSSHDIDGQASMGIPWGVATVVDGQVSPILWWGPGIAIPPLIGREYRSGPSGSDGRGDCFALIRDWYDLQSGIVLKEFGRDPEFWHHGLNLYENHYEDAGFKTVGKDDIKPGDVVLIRLRCNVSNHGGVYIGRGLWMHHLFNRLSVREPIDRWNKHISFVLRYKGK